MYTHMHIYVYDIYVIKVKITEMLIQNPSLRGEKYLSEKDILRFNTAVTHPHILLKKCVLQLYILIMRT